jgi:hypothetical protein
LLLSLVLSLSLVLPPFSSFYHPMSHLAALSLSSLVSHCMLSLTSRMSLSFVSLESLTSFYPHLALANNISLITCFELELRRSPNRAFTKPPHPASLFLPPRQRPPPE